MRSAIINDGLLTVVVLTLVPLVRITQTPPRSFLNVQAARRVATKGMPIGPALPSHTGCRRFHSHMCEPFCAVPTPCESTAAKGRSFAGNGTETWNSSAAADQSVTHYIVRVSAKSGHDAVRSWMGRLLSRA